FNSSTSASTSTLWTEAKKARGSVGPFSPPQPCRPCLSKMRRAVGHALTISATLVNLVMGVISFSPIGTEGRFANRPYEATNYLTLPVCSMTFVTTCKPVACDFGHCWGNRPVVRWRAQAGGTRGTSGADELQRTALHCNLGSNPGLRPGVRALPRLGSAVPELA